MTAQEPGQAARELPGAYEAYEAYVMAAPDDLSFPEWRELPAWQKLAIAVAVQAGYEARAAARDAAQEPKPEAHNRGRFAAKSPVRLEGLEFWPAALVTAWPFARLPSDTTFQAACCAPGEGE